MKSKPGLIRQLCCIPALAFALQATVVHAEMLGADKALESPAPTETDQNRAKVKQFLDRANVRERLQALGVDALNARDRVDAMTDAEVHAMAERIDAMPAGGALSQNDIILILLVAILVLVAL